MDTAPTEPAPTTTWPASVGVVTVAEASYDITATCYAPGAGEVLAIGSAMTPDGDRVELYLQAFLGAPYVGISVYGAQTITYEAAIDRPLTITYEANILRADDIDLVTDHWMLFGEYDLIARVQADEEFALTRCIVEEIRQLPGIQETKTLIGAEL